ncbi:hypothetical protein F4553_002006 [Allocatelliglobosispora scoriae]|uniref:Uncharacterized protein n=1 Tax=Allocatelliglobosispora scoriae TaxID=643052 RepID=A0A841BHQ1_9ACTN|nr:hypothetical protein [Allocatelliglobosispora scoriae]
MNGWLGLGAIVSQAGAFRKGQVAPYRFACCCPCHAQHGWNRAPSSINFPHHPSSVMVLVLVVASYPMWLKAAGFSFDQSSRLVSTLAEVSVHLHLVHIAAGAPAALLTLMLAIRAYRR